MAIWNTNIFLSSAGNIPVVRGKREIPNIYIWIQVSYICKFDPRYRTLISMDYSTEINHLWFPYQLATPWLTLCHNFLLPLKIIKIKILKNSNRTETLVKKKIPSTQNEKYQLHRTLQRSNSSSSSSSRRPASRPAGHQSSPVVGEEPSLQLLEGAHDGLHLLPPTAEDTQPRRQSKTCGMRADHGTTKAQHSSHPFSKKRTSIGYDSSTATIYSTYTIDCK